MPSLKANIQESAGGGFVKNARGFSGNEAVNGGCSDEGCSVSWIDIMAKPARAKQPAPTDTWAERQSDISRAEAAAERDAVMCPQDIGGRVAGL